VKTASGATAVQIVYSSCRGVQEIDHIGSAHDGAELECPQHWPLLTVANQLGRLLHAMHRGFV
jgi:hypothetical protein